MSAHAFLFLLRWAYDVWKVLVYVAWFSRGRLLKVCFMWHKTVTALFFGPATNPSGEMGGLDIVVQFRSESVPLCFLCRWTVPHCSFLSEPRTWRSASPPLPVSRGGPGLRAETPGRLLSLRIREQRSCCLHSLWRIRLRQPQKQVQSFF